MTGYFYPKRLPRLLQILRVLAMWMFRLRYLIKTLRANRKLEKPEILNMTDP